MTSLPTVVETHKSIDGVTYFKAGEIGRVLVVQEGSHAEELPKELSDGLTPAMADVRRRRWRKRPARDPAEVEQVAVELEALRGGSLKPECELIRVEEQVPVDEPEPSPLPQPVKIRFGADGPAVVHQPKTHPSQPSGADPSAPPSAPAGSHTAPRVLPARPPPATQRSPQGAQPPAHSAPQRSPQAAALGAAAAATVAAQMNARPAPSPSAHATQQRSLGAAPPSVGPRITITGLDRPSAGPATEGLRAVDGAGSRGLATVPAPSQQPPATTADPEAIQRARTEIQQHEADISKFRALVSRVGHADRQKLNAKIDTLTKARDAAKARLQSLGGS